MNTKDVLALVNRKYEFIKEEATKEIDEKIDEAKHEKENIIKEIKNELTAVVKKMTEAKGLAVRSERDLFNYRDYYADYPKINELYKEKENIEKSIEKEKIEFIDEIIVLGIKDDLVKEKIKQLLEIK